MNYNAHWNRNFEAVSPQASDCASQFITWFNLVNILWKKYEPYWERPPGRRGEAASWHTCPILSFWNNIEMFKTCFRLQNAFWKFSDCSNPFTSPNFKRLYSLTEQLFKIMMMKNLQKLKTSSIHHTFILKPFWGV